MERVILVWPTKITGPVKVDHLQSWSRIFWLDQTEMVRSIWCNNWNFQSVGLNGKCPWWARSQPMSASSKFSSHFPVMMYNAASNSGAIFRKAKSASLLYCHTRVFYPLTKIGRCRSSPLWFAQTPWWLHEKTNSQTQTKRPAMLMRNTCLTLQTFSSPCWSFLFLSWLFMFD